MRDYYSISCWKISTVVAVHVLVYFCDASILISFCFILLYFLQLFRLNSSSKKTTILRQNNTVRFVNIFLIRIFFFTCFNKINRTLYSSVTILWLEKLLYFKWGNNERRCDVRSITIYLNAFYFSARETETEIMPQSAPHCELCFNRWWATYALTSALIHCMCVNKNYLCSSMI